MSRLVARPLSPSSDVAREWIDHRRHARRLVERPKSFGPAPQRAGGARVAGSCQCAVFGATRCGVVGSATETAGERAISLRHVGTALCDTNRHNTQSSVWTGPHPPPLDDSTWCVGRSEPAFAMVASPKSTRRGRMSCNTPHTKANARSRRRRENMVRTLSGCVRRRKLVLDPGLVHRVRRVRPLRCKRRGGLIAGLSPDGIHSASHSRVRIRFSFVYGELP